MFMYVMRFWFMLLPNKIFISECRVTVVVVQRFDRWSRSRF